MNKIRVIKDRCTSCGICEMVCSITKNGVLNPKQSRIRVKEMFPIPGYPEVCTQCKNPLCKKACSVDAIENNNSGTVLVSYGKCIKCMKCVEACPFGTMFVDIHDGKPIKCDLCNGDPQCVRYCPTGALIYK